MALTMNEIKRFISEDATSARKRYAAVGERYYNAEHDILNYRMFYWNADEQLVEDKSRANNRISHPFFTELVDQETAYILSSEENPIKAVEKADGLQEHLDSYFDDEFWSEFADLLTDTITMGFGYMYAYQNSNDRLAFQCADGMGVVEVPAKYASDDQAHFLFWSVDRIEKGTKLIKRIEDHTATEITIYRQVNDGKIILDTDEPVNPRPHVVWKDPNTGGKYGDGLGFIPFWPLYHNKRQTSGLKPIKGLIDDYDLMECGLSNNLQDFDTPIHLVSGFEGDDLTKLQQNLKTKKIVGVGEGGGLDIKTVAVPFEARKTKADEDEKNIYRFGMGLNTAGLKDSNTTTNLMIKAAYTLLDLKAKKLIDRLKPFLKHLIKPVLDEINRNHGTGYGIDDVEIKFKPVIPTNEQEDAQIELTKAQAEQMRINTVLQVAAVIGDEEVLKAICDILDLDFNDLKHLVEEKKEVQNLLDAQNTLEDTVPEDSGHAEQPVLAPIA